MSSSPRGCVAAGHPLTAEAALKVLEAGGNAVDAAIAALCMSCVAEPSLCSLGGGAFCLVRTADGEARLYDFFVHTPICKREREGLDFQPIVADFGAAQQEFHIGLGSAATPGLARGIFAVHRAHGALPMAEVMAPAIAAARKGMILTSFQSYIMQVIAPILRHSAASRAIFSRGDAAGTILQAGDFFANAELGGLFEAMAYEGDRLFYEGEIAASIERLSREHGGHLTREDLRAYQVIVREPLRLRYRGAELLTNPPPSSGGLLIAFGLALLAGRDLQALPFGQAEYAALLAEVQAATQRARGRHGAIPILLDPEVIAEAMAELEAAPLATRGTTHLSVIDRDGNAAAITASNGEGCGYMVPGTGTMLNNMLGEEDLNPGGFHAWAPATRMASMMSPTAVLGDDGGLMVLGSGGSKRIRSAILQVLVNRLDHGMSIAEAVAAPRLHFDDGHLNVEPGLSAAAYERLAARFPEHTFWPATNMFFGGVHAVVREPDGALHGAGDPRRQGVCLDRLG
jgi:gamma-glutamyltranspeptidase/glutathione hydrolase